MLQVLITMNSKLIVAFALLGCLAFASAQQKPAAAKRPATAMPVEKHAPLTGACDADAAASEHSS
jgi:hypothetical protein